MAPRAVAEQANPSSQNPAATLDAKPGTKPGTNQETKQDAGSPRIPQLLRDLSPQVVAALTRYCRDFAAAENAVQEALLVAAEAWPLAQLPEHPEAWLLQLATQRLSEQTQVVVRNGLSAAAALDGDAGDQTLDLWFLCCHGSLGTTEAMALTLRALGGLATVEIAAGLSLSVTAVEAHISRAVGGLEPEQRGWVALSVEQRQSRLPDVLDTLYRIYHEGYGPRTADSSTRPDLALEAVRLARRLMAALPEEAEVEGLLALLLLTEARRAARVGPAGALVPLDRQDRRRWNQQVIAEGATLLTSALRRGKLGPYQLRAAIAATHDRAKTWEATEWSDILGLYDLLLGITRSSVVALDRLVAVVMVHGPREALQQLDALQSDSLLAQSHRPDALRAQLLQRLGRRAEASACYLRAAQRAGSAAERNYLAAQAALLQSELE